MFLIILMAADECLVYFRNASYSRTICQSVSKNTACARMADRLIGLRLTNVVHPEFSIFAFNAKEDTIQI